METILSIVAGLYGLIFSVGFQKLIVKNPTEPRLASKIKRLLEKGEDSKAVALANNVFSDKKRHHLLIGMLSPLVLLFPLAFFAESWLPAEIGGGAFLIGHLFAAQKTRKFSPEGKKRSQFPWEYGGVLLERAILKVLVAHPTPLVRDFLREAMQTLFSGHQRVLIEELVRTEKAWAMDLLRPEAQELKAPNDNQILLPESVSGANSLTAGQLWEKLNQVGMRQKETFLPLAFRLEKTYALRFLREAARAPKQALRERGERLMNLFLATELMHSLKKAMETANHDQKEIFQRIYEAVALGEVEALPAFEALYNAWDEYPEIEQEFAKLQTDKIEEWVKAAARALVPVENRAARSAILLLLLYPDEKVQTEVWHAIDQKKDLDLADIISLYHKAPAPLKDGLLELLPDFPFEKSRKLIEEALRDPDYGVRGITYSILGDFPSEPAILDLLRKVNNESYEYVKREGMIALSRLENHGALEVLAQIHEEGAAKKNRGKAREIGPDQLSFLRKLIRNLAEKIARPEQVKELLCKNCLTRAETKKIAGQKIPECRRCGQARFLQPGVKKVIGFVGPGKEKREPGEKEWQIPLWNEAQKKPLYADLTHWQIRGGASFDYNWAVNAVLEELENGSGLSPYPVPLQQLDNPPLNNNTQKQLERLKRTEI